MLADLLATDGVTEQLVVGSEVGLLALHGGLEAATFEIATEVARRSGASFYGVRQPDDLSWHVPSHRYDPRDSTRLATFCDHVEVAVSIHGFGGVRDHPRRWTTILLGGAGRAEAAALGAELRPRLPDYDVIDDLDAIPRQYRGVHPRNPVNRVRRAGVQVELPPRVRGTGPVWADHDFGSDPWVPHTMALIEGLLAGVTALVPSIGEIPQSEPPVAR